MGKKNKNSKCQIKKNQTQTQTQTQKSTPIIREKPVPKSSEHEVKCKSEFNNNQLKVLAEFFNGDFKSFTELSLDPKYPKNVIKKIARYIIDFNNLSDKRIDRRIHCMRQIIAIVKTAEKFDEKYMEELFLIIKTKFGTIYDLGW